MRHWTVAGGLIEHGGRLLLVRNLRRDGTYDWSTPGGVIDDGESVIEGLTREVQEETGLAVTGWDGPLWEVEAEAPDMGWMLRVEVHLATGFVGEVAVDDPDGIVTEAAWHDVEGCADSLATSWTPAREPMMSWLDERWSARRLFRYRVEGPSRAEMTVVRLSE